METPLKENTTWLTISDMEGTSICSAVARLAMKLFHRSNVTSLATSRQERREEAVASRKSELRRLSRTHPTHAQRWCSHSSAQYRIGATPGTSNTLPTPKPPRLLKSNASNDQGKTPKDQ
jgi:hypothetical protein